MDANARQDQDEKSENLPSDLGATGKELIAKFREETKNAKNELKETKNQFETQQQTINELQKQLEELKKVPTTKKEENNSETADERIIRIEQELQKEREQRELLAQNLQQKELRETFLTKLKAAGIRDDESAIDLYNLTKSELTNSNIDEILKTQLEKRKYFFESKTGVSHNGSSDGINDSHGLTSEQLAIAASFGMTPEQYKQNIKE